ncbi:MAG TPA: carcinine hydrolase/isopenicillin-N N-acyltransferase family protein [Verrucomicrobiota bacterium]|nr:carcinine hydrolase/isopenicillin-N N-acyltransferase family protein [Verrucomicrobiota bacterium]
MAQAVLAMPGPSARFINRNWPFTLWQLLILLFLGGISCASVHACTLWGAAGVDAGGGTIISKNRDWKPDHVQVLKMQRPTNGYAYFGLYAEGDDAPGIKEGINEKGLTVLAEKAG